MGKIWTVLKQTFKEWNEDKAPRLAASLAYYTVFSIPPLLIIVIGIAAFFFGRSQAQESILNQISGMVGSQGGQAIGTILKSANGPGGGLVASIVGIVLLLFGASGVFGQLQDALNTIWEVQPKPGQGVGAMIRKRFFTFTMVVGVGFLLLVSLVISAFLAGLGRMIQGLMPGSNFLFQTVNFAVSFLLITFLFAITYRVVPDAKVAWKDVWLGAAVTSLLFTIGKQLIGLYLGNSSVGSTFGVFGSLIILMVWVYYSSQILLFGAEFTQVYANLYGSHVVPEKTSELVTEETRENEGIPHKEAQREVQPAHEQYNPGISSQRALAGGVAGAGMSYEANSTDMSARTKETTGMMPRPTLPPTHPEVEPTTWRLIQAAFPSLLAFGVGIVGSVIIARTPPRKPAPAAAPRRKGIKLGRKKRK